MLPGRRLLAKTARGKALIPPRYAARPQRLVAFLMDTPIEVLRGKEVGVYVREEDSIGHALSQGERTSR